MHRITLSAARALIPAFAVALVAALPQVATAQSGPPQGFPDLVGGLLATEGVLGVETAQTSSGKNVIFAWFEDKSAALRWYYSDMHRGVQNAFFPDRPPHTPLAGIADDAGPILAIASITMSERPQFEGVNLPISQIAIELYQPLPGGFYLGGRFAPGNVAVPMLQGQP
jgi:hypothetical protein